MIGSILESWRQARDLPRPLWILFAVTLVNRMGTMALPFLALFLSKKLHYTTELTGLIIGGYGVGAMVTSPLAGYLSDRWGPVRLMKLGLIASGLFLLAYPWVASVEGIFLLTILWAIFSEAFRPASLSIVGEYAPAEMRKTAFAVNRLAINLGMSFGPALGGFVVLLSYDLLFYINGAMSIAAGCLLALSSLRDSPIEKMPHRIGDLFAPLRDRRLILFLFAVMLVLAVFFQNEATMPLFLVNEIGLSESAYGLIWLVNTGLIILLEIHINTTMSHWSHRASLALGAFLVGLGYGLQVGIWEMTGVLLTFAVWTVGEMIFFPTAAAFVSDIAPDDKRGQYMGLLQMMFSIAFILGPTVGTATMSAHGSTVLWAATFGVGTLAAILLLRLPKEVP